MRRLILDFGMYLAYFVVLWYFLIKTVPLPTVSLKMHEALADLLLDEEFSEDQVRSCIYCYVYLCSHKIPNPTNPAGFESQKDTWRRGDVRGAVAVG